MLVWCPSSTAVLLFLWASADLCLLGWAVRFHTRGWYLGINKSQFPQKEEKKKKKLSTFLWQLNATAYFSYAFVIHPSTFPGFPMYYTCLTRSASALLLLTFHIKKMSVSSLNLPVFFSSLWASHYSMSDY